MADLTKTVDIIFQGSDAVSDVLKTVSGKMGEFSSSLESIGAPFEAIIGKIELVGAAIVGIGAAGVAASAEIDAESKKMEASLGLLPEEAERFKGIAKEVYNEGIVEDLGTAFEAVALAQKKFGDDADVDLGKVVNKAMEIQRTFNVDYQDSLLAANSLMENFGISSDEAFGFIITGLQDGLNSSGDFLESINEYGVQFGNGGGSATDFFDIMKGGFQDGVLGTDKAADAFKEFRVRIVDGSQPVKDALESIGIDEAELTANINSGKTTIMDAFTLVVKKLNETTDTSTKMQAGVGLMGDKFEDLGTQVALSLSKGTTSLDDFKKALDSTDYKTFSQQFLQVWRSLTTAFSSLELWDTLKEKFSEAFKDIKENIPKVFEELDFTEIEDKIQKIWDTISNIFTDNNLDLTTFDGLKNAAELVIESIGSFLDVMGGMAEVISPIVSIVISIVEKFNSLDSNTKELMGNIIAIGGSFTTLAGIIGVGSLLASGLAALITFITGPAGLTIALVTLVGGALADAINSFNDLEETTKNYRKTVDDLKTTYSNLPTELKTKLYAEIDNENWDEVNNIIKNLPEEVKTSIIAEINEGNIEEAKLSLSNFPEEIQTDIITALDDGDYSKAIELIGEIPDQEIIEVFVTPDPDGEVQKLVKSIPGEIKSDIVVGIQNNNLEEYEEQLNRLPAEKKTEILAAVEEGNFVKANDILSKIPDDKITIIKSDFEANTVKNVQEFTSILKDDIPDNLSVSITAAIEEGRFDDVQQLINTTFKDPVEITPYVPDSATEDISRSIEEIVYILENDIPSDKTIEISGNYEEGLEEIEKIATALKDQIPEESYTKITAAIEEDSLVKATELLNDAVQDREFEIKGYVTDDSIKDINKKVEEIPFYTESGGWQTITVPIEPTLNKKDVEKDADELATKLDPLKVLEIKADLEIADIDLKKEEIKANADIIQSAMKFKAEVDIAEIEAATERVLSSFESINEGMNSTGELITSALDSLRESTSVQEKWAALDVLEQEMELRVQEFELQKKLIEAQTENLEIKNRILEETEGTPTIKIESEGLEPALELLLWEVLEKVQVRATETYSEFLLGIGDS